MYRGSTGNSNISALYRSIQQCTQWQGAFINKKTGKSRWGDPNATPGVPLYGWCSILPTGHPLGQESSYSRRQKDQVEESQFEESMKEDMAAMRRLGV